MKALYMMPLQEKNAWWILLNWLKMVLMCCKKRCSHLCIDYFGSRLQTARKCT